MQDSPLPPCSILLLAGGRAQRMGGRDKGLLEWHGRPLIAWLHDVVRPLTDDLILSCNRSQARYAAYADRLAGDAEPDFPGPLAGIRAGLAMARHPWLLVLPCDAPLIDRALLDDMRRTASQTGSPLMLHQAGHWEPLFALIPTRLADDIEAAWRDGERSPGRILASLGAHGLELQGDDPRTGNLNTPDDLARAARPPRP